MRVNGAFGSAWSDSACYSKSVPVKNKDIKLTDFTVAGTNERPRHLI